jgi:hypothetical protein
MIAKFEDCYFKVSYFWLKLNQYQGEKVSHSNHDCRYLHRFL